MQAKKNAKDSEEKLMEDAKAEDMDSDEDEAEWEAKWREKRKAQLKELEGISTRPNVLLRSRQRFFFCQWRKRLGLSELAHIEHELRGAYQGRRYSIIDCT